MNHTDLKNYAPQARRDFIQAVTDRAALYGVTAAKIEPVTEKGDVAIIAGHAFPRSVIAKRKKLVDRIDRDGFNQTMEALAYTWFNRFVAIRFMELHGYLEHGYRVLSHPDPTKRIPEILELAEHVDLPGLSREKVIDLKLDVNKEAELYQMLLLAQCHALHSAMPFLFEAIDDETELVLPENLLHSDSIIRKLVDASDPEDWQEVEVIGWLYQFYISERKDEVMARKSAVPTEDIPAVTQLFTPHWIVRYLVENSLGRLWLLNHPGSKLRERMPYYIEGEAESDFLKITKPEEIRLLDPAAGSGHMLTYAFDLLTFIYEEEGYTPSEIPALILRHNLHGLEICPRAAQLAALALVFKARANSRRFFQPDNLVPPDVIDLRDVRFEENELRDYVSALGLSELFDQTMLRLLHQFEEAKNVGSLIHPCLDRQAVTSARSAIEAKSVGGHLFRHETHLKVLRVLEQAEMLCHRYQIVVVNPPYMTAGMNSSVVGFLSNHFRDSRADLSATFISCAQVLCLSGGFCALVTMHSWMFLSTLEKFRKDLLSKVTILNLTHHGIGAFPTLNSKVVQTAAFVLKLEPPDDEHRPICFRLLDYDAEVKERQFLKGENRFDHLRQREFSVIPGSPVAYWISPKMRLAFEHFDALEDIADARIGMATGRNATYVRYWHEVATSRIGFDLSSRSAAKESRKKWFPYAKGGDFRKWFGNSEFVVDWSDDGYALQTTKHPGGERIWAHNFNLDQIFRPSVCWTVVTNAETGFRYHPLGYIFDAAAGLCQAKDTSDNLLILGVLNSRVAANILKIINPTVNLHPGYLGRLPIPPRATQSIAPLVQECLALAKTDWDNFETSWDFRDQPLLRAGTKEATLEVSWGNWEARSTAAIRRMQELETENNRAFIDAYGLGDEMKPEVPGEQITLARPDARHDMATFLSYAVGCMMGRYSLDRPSLILADSGDTLELYLSKIGKPLNELAFIPDEDGIIPVLDGEWFKRDIVARVHAFLRATFGEATLEASLRFIDESLGKDLRTYFVTDFYKDHLQTYNKRPIYWLFSSGKEQAFQALVYMHRYHESTLSRMRTEYVIPLQGKIASRIDQLAEDIQKATSTSHRKKMEKERDKLLRQRTELQAFDEKLRHFADQRIQLDLDDGVKVNYGKFGDLLADVKAVTGGSDE